MSTRDHVGSVIAGYRVESVLGRGGMGVVYLAHDLRLERRVALKIVSPELKDAAGFRERFIRESKLAASIDHPNILPIYDAGEDGELLYLAMRYVEGTDLRRLIDDRGPLDQRVATALTSQVALALDAAHAHGLVHRDVKPGNVLIAADESLPGGGHVYLADFGLTKRMSSDSGLTATGQFVGTLAYAAPEQFEGTPLDARTDEYSLACVLFECLTGEEPYRRENDAAVMYAHLMAPIPSVRELRPELPEALAEALATGMAKSPDDRFQSAGALAAATREAVGAEPIAAPTAPGRAARSRRPAVWGVVVAAAVAVIAVLLLTRGGNTPAPAATGTGTPAAAAGQALRIDSASHAVTASAPLPEAASDVAAGDGMVWVANPTAGTASQLDPESGSVTATVDVGGEPVAVGVGEGAVWVVNRGDGSVSRIDPATRAVTSIPVGTGIARIAVGGGSVWVANRDQNLVSRIDPESNAVVATVPVRTAGKISDIAVDGTDVLVATYDNSAGLAAIIRVDRTGRTHPIGIMIDGGSPASPGPALAVGGDEAWGTITYSSQIRPIDTTTGQTGEFVTVCRRPVDLAIDAVGNIWVVSGTDGSLWELSPDGSTKAVIQVGAGGRAVAVGDNAVWVVRSG